MDTKKQAVKVIKLLKKEYPKAKIALKSVTPMQLLVAVILSAQCTDKQVNKVTASLFKKYKTPKDFANANLNTFKQEIRSTGFYNNKAKNIIASAKTIQKNFDGKVPDNMEDLLKLHGVARKTANVVISAIYHKNLGVCCDTHVCRLSQRWSLTKNKDPVKIEQDLMSIIPKKDWEKFSLMTIKHGRQVCYARKPNCAGCFLNKICPKNGVNTAAGNRTPIASSLL